MTVPASVDRRFRDAAASSGLVDVAYDVMDSPLGPLFVAATEAGVCRIAYDADPAQEEERLARVAGVRVLRSPKPLERAERELHDYFAGRRRRFDVTVDLRLAGDFHRRVLAELAEVPFGQLTTYGELARRAGNPRAARAVGAAMNRNPIPIVLPCHRVVGSSGKLVGYAGGLARKERLLRLEGVLV